MGDVSRAMGRLAKERTEREKRAVRFRPKPHQRPPSAPIRRSAPERVRPAVGAPQPPAGGLRTRPSAGVRTPAVAPEFFSASAPLIAIPRSKAGFWHPRCVALANSSSDAEDLRHLAVKVANALAERRTSSLLVTSPLQDEGKTTVACNLALALASLASGKPVALVELDLRKPDLANVMGVSVGRGIETVLRGAAPLRTRRIRTDYHTLDLFLAGSAQQDIHTLLSGPVISGLVAELSTQYAATIIDAPSVIPFPDAALLMNHVGASLTVVKRGHTRRAALDEALTLLPEQKNIGTFFNYCALARHRKKR